MRLHHGGLSRLGRDHHAAPHGDPRGDPNPDSAPDGVNATATAGKKVVTPTIKAPTANADGLVTYNLGTSPPARRSRRS